MKRLVCLALSLLILMSAVTAFAQTRNKNLDAAFDSGFPTLAETESSSVKLTASDFEVSEEAIAALAGAGAAGEEDIGAALAETLLQTAFVPLSKSPSGISGILAAGESAVTVYDGKYHIIYPSAKGVPDENDNLNKYFMYINSRIRSLIGEEGIVYSPDGRYAAICNKNISLQKMDFFLDPILLDLSTGGLILTATYPNKPMKDKNAGVVTSALFSSDNKSFYYILYGNFNNARIRLYRYDLETGKTELCLESEKNLYYPHLAELADGSILMINDCYKKGETQGLVVASFAGGAWSVEETKLPLDRNYCYAGRLNYSPNAGLACLVENTGNSSFAFQLVNPNARFEGIDQFRCIRKDTDELVAVSPEEFRASVDEDPKDNKGSGLSLLYPYQTILNAVFSPDGRYLLLNTSGDTANGRSRNLFLVRLEDMSIRKVSGLDAEKIMVANPGRNYPISIEWNTDELIIGTDDGIRTYEFTAGK